MRPAAALALPALLLAAACGGEQLHASTLHPAAKPAAPASHRPAAVHPGASTTVRTVSNHHRRRRSTTSVCSTAGLSVTLGQPGSAAGSRYQPIVFTNTTETSCTLTGYPGVSFVAPGTGRQVGAAAARNAQHAVVTVTLLPGASASALLQIVDYANYPAAGCSATPVSGLRVYPPGNTAAAYIPFDSPQNACSSQADQLAVDTVIPAATG